MATPHPSPPPPPPRGPPPAPPADILTLEHVTRYFGPRRAVDDACLRLAPGESLCLVGGNGAGKSTLLALAAGILSPDEGRVLICNQHLARHREARRSVGYMGDQPLLYDALSARENLAFFARLYALPRPRRRRRIDELLQRVGLDDRADDPAAALSSGMRRRLDLARALLHQGRLLLLDEPMNSLDRHGRELIEQLAGEIAATGAAILWTAHQPPERSKLASRIIYITGGRLSDADPPAGRSSGSGDSGNASDSTGHSSDYGAGRQV